MWAVQLEWEWVWCGKEEGGDKGGSDVKGNYLEILIQLGKDKD